MESRLWILMQRKIIIFHYLTNLAGKMLFLTAFCERVKNILRKNVCTIRNKKILNVNGNINGDRNGDRKMALPRLTQHFLVTRDT